MLSENELTPRVVTRTSRAGMSSAFRFVVKKTVGFLTKFLPRVQHSIDKGLTVFAFHDVSNTPSEFAKRYGLVVSTEIFERQIQWIKANFEIIHPSMILGEMPLPKRAAVITFDDGYRGTFENGLPILERLGVPSIIFLNMQPILLGTPVLSAMSCYLEKYVPDFSKFCHRSGLVAPFHMSLNPTVWDDYQRDYASVNLTAVKKFQGAFADSAALLRWDNHSLVSYGNHLFEHWNAVALSSEELKEQYLRNEAALAGFAARVNLFAFTNGQPDTCFSKRDLALLQSMGAGRVFSTAGGVNKGKLGFLLGRVALCESDKDEDLLWFRIGRAVLQGEANVQN